MIYVLIILWAYVAVVLALMASEIRDRRDSRENLVPFTRVLQSAVVLIVLAPLLVYAARIDWYGDEEQA